MGLIVISSFGVSLLASCFTISVAVSRHRTAPKASHNRHREDTFQDEGEIHRSRAIPDSRFGMEIPRTEVSIRIHDVNMRYGEIKWLSDTLNLEDPNTKQAIIFSKAVEKMESAQMRGQYAVGTEMQFSFGLTKDELGYVYKLVETIGFARDHKLTPSEQKLKDEGIARGDW